MSELRLQKELEKSDGIKLNQLDLLRQALTHKSYAHENSVLDNERLEFLGDALVNMIISVELFRRYPEKTEGELSKMRAFLVDEPSLHQMARRLDLGSQIRLGRGELKASSSENPRLLASTFEAVLAAVYLDQGLSTCEKLVRRLFSEELNQVQNFKKLDKDFKTQFQEVIQKKYQTTPVYKVICSDAEGTEVEVSVQGRPLAQGLGKNRKQAEQNAAELAMKKVEI